MRQEALVDEGLLMRTRLLVSKNTFKGAAFLEGGP